MVKGWPWGWTGLSGGSLGHAFAPETGRSFVLVSSSPAFLLGDPRLSGVALGLSPSSAALAVWPQGQGWLLSLSCVEGNVCPQGQRLEVPSSGCAVGATTGRRDKEDRREEGPGVVPLDASGRSEGERNGGFDMGQRTPEKHPEATLPSSAGSPAPEHLQEAWGGGAAIPVGQTAESQSPPPRARSLPSAALTSCHHLASPPLAIPVHRWVN